MDQLRTQKILIRYFNIYIAIEIYELDWNKIASFVSTRNIAQVRSHAQKYFNKKKSD